jgi:hypothetical protein
MKRTYKLIASRGNEIVFECFSRDVLKIQLSLVGEYVAHLAVWWHI